MYLVELLSESLMRHGMKVTKVDVMSIYPTMDSLAAVEAYAQSKLPISCWNDLHAVLMIHQNTLLKVIEGGVCK